MAPEHAAAEKTGSESIALDAHEPSWPRLRFAAFCYIQSSTSSLDWALGPLFPAIQAHYGIPYRTAALLLIAQMIGTHSLAACPDFSGAYLAFPVNVMLAPRLGVTRTLALGGVSMLIASVISCFDVPFPVFVIAYGIWGLGQIVSRTQTDSRAVS